MNAAAQTGAGSARFYQLSLVIHLAVLGALLLIPGVREFLVTRISMESESPPPMESFQNAIRELSENSNDPAARARAMEAGRDLAAKAAAARDAAAREQARALAERLGVSPEEALRLRPPSNEELGEFDRMLESLETAEGRERALALAAEIEAGAARDADVESTVAGGLTPTDGLTALTRAEAIELLEKSSGEPSLLPRDLTGLMRSSYGDETATGGKPSAGKALLMDAVPGRVQSTRSGLTPPPVLDNKWLSKVFRGSSLPSLPASRLTSSGSASRAGPVFLDSWHILGPWPLNSEADFSKAFPPETDGVDLDASYTGKGGRQIRWEFIQSSEALVEIPLQVPDSATYAFTSVRVEQETEAWILCGSDDRMKLWINGLPIFGSAASLKGWHIGNEGARKILLRKGRNDILLRVDNLPGFTRFSVVLMPGDSDATLFTPLR